MRLLLAVFIFALLLCKIDRLCLKASRGFCRHFVEVPLTHNPAWESHGAFPASLFDKPFYFLGKGAQNFVFESADKKYVLKLYKYPSHMRKFSWLSHPFGYHFSPKRIALKKHNLNRFDLSFNSYHLAHHVLQDETGVIYLHLNPTQNLQKTVELHDRTGVVYHLPLDTLRFVIQKKGEPFLSLFAKTHDQKKMIDSLFDLISSRVQKGITDLDNMEHDNYGWADGRAIHLDVGRFKQEKVPLKEELKRVTSPLRDLLKDELLQYYNDKIERSAEN